MMRTQANSQSNQKEKVSEQSTKQSDSIKKDVDHIEVPISEKMQAN